MVGGKEARPEMLISIPSVLHSTHLFIHCCCRSGPLGATLPQGSLSIFSILLLPAKALLLPLPIPSVPLLVHHDHLHQC